MPKLIAIVTLGLTLFAACDGGNGGERSESGGQEDPATASDGGTVDDPGSTGDEELGEAGDLETRLREQGGIFADVVLSGDWDLRLTAPTHCEGMFDEGALETDPRPEFEFVLFNSVEGDPEPEGLQRLAFTLPNYDGTGEYETETLMITALDPDSGEDIEVAGSATVSIDEAEEEDTMLGTHLRLLGSMSGAYEGERTGSFEVPIFACNDV